MTRAEEPYIWLQWDDGEAIGIADCGCELVQNHKASGAALFFCNTHTAAPELLAACQAALDWLEDSFPNDLPNNANQLRAAIAKAEGR